MELFYACPSCEKARHHASELMRFGPNYSNGVQLFADGWTRRDKPDCPLELRKVTVTCAVCRSTGLVPTEEGKKIIALVEWVLNRRAQEEEERKEELPV